MRRTTIFLLALIQLLTLFSPLVAYADEGEEETETEEVELQINDSDRGGNIYADGNTLAITALEATAEYDPYVHYVTTYNTLVSRMNEQPRTTPYAQISKGEIGSAVKGTGQKVVDEHGKKETNAFSVTLDDIEEVDHEARVGDALANMPEEYAGLTEDEIPETIARLEEEIAEEITTNVMNALSSELSINLGAGDVKRHARKNHAYNTTVVGFWGQATHMGKSGQHVGAGFYYLDDIKNNLGSADANPVYTASLKEIISSDVGKGGFGVEKITGEFAEGNVLYENIRKAENKYQTEYTIGVGDEENPKVYFDAERSGLYLSPIGKDGKEDIESLWSVTTGGEFTNNWHQHNALTSWDSEDYRNVHYLITPTGTKDRDEGIEIVETVGVEFVKSRYLYTYEFLPVERDRIGKKIMKAYNDVIGTQKTKALKTLIEINELEVNEEVKSLAWTPIYPKVVVDSQSDNYEAFVAQMEKIDSRVKVSGDSIKMVNDDRTLQTMDIFLGEDNPSPVLVGARSNGIRISRLHLGGVNGSVNSGEQDTHIYVWRGINIYGNLSSGSDTYLQNAYYTDRDTRGNYLFGLYTRELDGYSGSFLENTVGKDATVGADNYGNVINGDTGEVLVPYWHNHMFEGEELNNHMFPYSPMIGTYGDVYAEDDEIESDYIKVVGLASADEIKSFVGGDNALYKDAIKIRGMLEKEQTIDNSLSVMENGYDGLGKEESMRALAVVISASTEDSVKDWNSKMLEDARDGRELYISYEPLKTDKEFEEEMEQRRWTAASLIQKIGWIMDYGFSDVIRLTVVSNLTRTYNTTVADAGLEYIFYTDNVTNTEEWAGMTVLLSTIIGAVITGYILLVGFKAYRGEMAWSKVIVKVFVLAGVLFYPVFVYGNLVDYAINKPTSAIMGNQMRLSVALDTYFVQENTTRNVNEFYENMFGKYADADDLQLGSYNLTFYTTTDKNGFDINETSSQDASLSLVQRNRLERYQSGRSEYPKDQLIAVDVALTDLYKWVWDVRYNGGGVEDETYGTGGTNSEMPTYEEIVEAGNVEPLFQWLAKGGSQYFGVSDYQPELASYEEYKIVPDVISPLDNMDSMSTEALSTYGATVGHYTELNGVEPKYVNYMEVESQLDTQILTASELFYEIVRNLSGDDEDTSLESLSAISYLATTPEAQDSVFYVPTSDDMRALVRDLSNTSLGRSYWYGGANNSGWSNFTRSVISGRHGTDGRFIDMDGKERQLRRNPELTPPKDDYLGLTQIVQKYTPNRGEINPYRRSTLEEDVSEINSGLLHEYLSTYYITKQSLGADEGRNTTALNHAEKMVMATEAFFQFNDALDWNNFPQTYAVDSIKFDKYMALVYIPFKDYGKSTMTFYDESEVIPMTTAEYVAMNESVVGYFFFIITVMAFVLFGMFYMAVLYFGVLLFSMYNFVKYYIIKSDYQNKSALGSVTIILIMSLSKMALMVLVWLNSWLMNRSVALSDTSSLEYSPAIRHSMILTGAIFAIFWLVIKPTWQGVMGDKENMGGQFFADKAQDIGKALTSGSFMPGRGKGVKGGSQASKFNDKKGRTKSGLDNNAGRLGNMNENGLNQARKQASAIGGGALGYGIGKNVANRTKESVSKVNDALQNRKDRKKGIDRMGRRHIDTSKVKAKNLIERKNLGDLGKAMNGITQTVSGLGAGAVQVAKVGAELDNFKTGVITTMAMGSAGAASVVAKNLMDKGIQARSEGSNVLFDSSGYDLSKDSVRSELFNNSVADLQDQNVTKHANVMEGLVDGSTATNYDYSRGDSRIGVALDKKTGIHPETYNQLSQTQEFKDMFITPRADELMYDRKGNVIGLPKGGLRLVNPQMSATEVQNNMNKLYDVDNKLRNENNLEQRDQSDKRGVNIEGMEESYYNENIASLIKDEKGMYTQGSRIVFDTNNGNHNRIMKQINQKVDEYNNGIESKYGEESNNLMRYVVNDGDNQAILTETVNADENKVVATALYGGKNYNQNVRKFKVDENEIGQVGDNIEAVNKLRSVTNKGDKNLTQAVNEFTSAKKDMRKLLNNEVHDMTPQDRVVFNHEMMNYLDTTQVGNTSEFKTVRGNLQSIEKQFKQNEISSDQYHELVRRENENLTKIMDSTGKMDGFILNRYDSKNPYIKQYEEKSRAKSKADKKEHKSLKDMYNASVDKLDKEVGRKNLMEMPVGVVEASTSKHGEEYHLDGKGVLVQRADARKKRNALDGQDKDSVMSYLMSRPLEIKDLRERKLASD